MDTTVECMSHDHKMDAGSPGNVFQTIIGNEQFLHLSNWMKISSTEGNRS